MNEEVSGRDPYERIKYLTNVIFDLQTRATTAEAERDALRTMCRYLYDTATWGRDLILMYDKFLIHLGEPEDKVRSQEHLAGLRKANNLISAYEIMQAARTAEAQNKPTPGPGAGKVKYITGGEEAMGGKPE